MKIDAGFFAFPCLFFKLSDWFLTDGGKCIVPGNNVLVSQTNVLFPKITSWFPKPMSCSWKSILREFGNPLRGTGEFQDMHAGISPIDDVDIAAVVNLHIVRLYRNLATLVGSGAHATF